MEYFPGEDGKLGHYKVAGKEVMKQSGKVTCLYDSTGHALGKSAREIRLGVVDVLKDSPHMAAPMIHTRNYLASTEEGKKQLMQGGYVGPMTSYANHMMVEQYINQKNEVEIKHFGSTMLEGYKQYCKEGAIIPII